MRKLPSVLSISVWVFVLAATVGCGSGGGEADSGQEPAAAAQTETESMAAESGATATATLEAKNDSGLSGVAVFTDEGDHVSLSIEIDSGPAGYHAVHIHEIGDCSAPDGTSAGGHWNPTAEDHGKWGMPPHHLGDIGNFELDPDGMGRLALVSTVWSLGTGQDNDVVGKAVIVHAGTDDFSSQPSGAAGARIGCGVIEQ